MLSAVLFTAGIVLWWTIGADFVAELFSDFVIFVMPESIINALTFAFSVLNGLSYIFPVDQLIYIVIWAISFEIVLMGFKIGVYIVRLARAF